MHRAHDERRTGLPGPHRNELAAWTAADGVFAPDLLERYVGVGVWCWTRDPARLLVAHCVRGTIEHDARLGRELLEMETMDAMQAGGR